ncbi:MAG TPA: alpha-L-fucosidase [Bacteroidales bacterium]|nr:alpha-L-fucosidase [Bacteroidales bacterium]
MRRFHLPLFSFVIIALILAGCNSNQWKSVGSGEPFSPWRYKHSIEALRDSFSEEMMADAGREVEELNEVNRKGPYKASRASLDHHATPEWYRDAKFCLFLDWGPYSIAGYGRKGWSRARYPDWYLNHMYNDYREYHIKTWGKDFQRDDFIPMFDARHFNANDIVDLVKMSGARYLVPFNKHHGGYCLWDSRFTQRDVVDMYPGRDLTEELVEACKKAGIYYGFYFSVEDYEYPMIGDNDSLYIRYWSKGMAPDNAGVVESEGEVTGKFDSSRFNRMVSGKVPVKNFVDDYIVPQAKDFIDKYDPDILWFDGEWQRPADYYRTPDIVAYFYNKAEGRKEVAANDRMGRGTRERHGDFYTSETDEVVDKMEYPWEENRSMSESYGYNHTDSLENYLSSDELIQMLVRIVAKGGNLNLIVNPDGKGTVSPLQLRLLKDMGAWLNVNGEAIYGSRPYEKLCDNTQLGQPVWYTMSKDSTWAYAIVFDWPKSETFICPGANPVWDSRVYMLGYDKPLEWVDTGRKQWGMSVKIPKEMLGNPEARPCRHAWVLKFRYDKDNKYGV